MSFIYLCIHLFIYAGWNNTPASPQTSTPKHRIPQSQPAQPLMNYPWPIQYRLGCFFYCSYFTLHSYINFLHFSTFFIVSYCYYLATVVETCKHECFSGTPVTMLHSVKTNTNPITNKGAVAWIYMSVNMLHLRLAPFEVTSCQLVTVPGFASTHFYFYS